MNDHFERIKSKYINAQGDSTDLFKEIVSAADEIGLDQAFAFLEQCVIEKRKTWIEQLLDEVKDTKQLVWDGY